eukprot:3934828-Rhodomonas_salina.1
MSLQPLTQERASHRVSGAGGSAAGLSAWLSQAQAGHKAAQRALRGLAKAGWLSDRVGLQGWLP